MVVRSTHFAVETLFDLLGWKFARDGDKAHEFSKSFGALGILIDLNKFDDGVVEFSNTPKRVEELIQTIDGLLKCKKMNLRESQNYEVGFSLQIANCSAERVVFV